LPRNKSFDEHQVLEKIGHLFWRQGYSSTSMDEICDHVSLTKTSVYNAYGDKASLFKKVVDWYMADVFIEGFAAMENGQTVSEKVSAFLRYFLVQQDIGIISRGCLLTSNLLEMQHTEPELYAYLNQQMSQVSTTIENYLAGEQRAGRLNGDADPAELAEYLMTLLQGLRVRSRNHPAPSDFGRVITLAMGPIKDAERLTENQKIKMH